MLEDFSKHFEFKKDEIQLKNPKFDTKKCPNSDQNRKVEKKNSLAQFGVNSMTRKNRSKCNFCIP